MEINIRKAGLSDMDLLIEWRMEVLHEVFAIPDACPAKELESENRRYYQRAIPAGEHIACFACIGEEVIGCGGMCLYSEMPSPDNFTGQCAYLMNIYTRPHFRGQGVGQMIVRWLTEQAVQRDISKIYLETSQAGKELYRKSGFVPMPDMMKLPATKNKI